MNFDNEKREILDEIDGFWKVEKLGMWNLG